MMVWKMIFLFQGCILRFHVNLPGCIFWNNSVVPIDYRTYSWREDALFEDQWSLLLRRRHRQGCYPTFGMSWNQETPTKDHFFHFQVILEVPYVQTSPDAIDWYEGISLKFSFFFLYLPCKYTENKDGDSHKNTTSYGSLRFVTGMTWFDSKALLEEFWENFLRTFTLFLRIVPW